MEPMTWVFLGVAVAAVVAAVWLARGRVAAEREAALERGRAEAAEARSGRAEVDASELSAALQRERAGQAALAAEVAALTERCRGIEARWGADAERAETLRVEALEAQASRHRAEMEAVRRETALERERDRALGEQRAQAAEEQRRQLEAALERAQAKFESVFDAAAGRALRSSSEEFLKLAQQKLAADSQRHQSDLDARKLAVEGLVKPIADTLVRTEAKLSAMEREAASAGAALRQQVEQMTQQGVALQRETGQLVQALREPRVRGFYGEVQLKRVAELAGMREYCDFVEQDERVSASGDRLRPDMVVRLPNGREVVVDAKANILPYMDALKAPTPEEAEACLQRFADGIAAQAVALGGKAYWANREGSPDFTVMFVPGDQFVDAALARRPDLLATAAKNNVILASPSTLIGLLRAVHVAFREEKLAREAAELLALGKEFHERAATALGHADKLGETLGRAVGHYNAFLGSYESRLAPTLERFEDIGAAGAKPRPELSPVTVLVRPMKQAAALPAAPAGPADAAPDPDLP